MCNRMPINNSTTIMPATRRMAPTQEPLAPAVHNPPFVTFKFTGVLGPFW